MNGRLSYISFKVKLISLAIRCSTCVSTVLVCHNPVNFNIVTMVFNNSIFI